MNTINVRSVPAIFVSKTKSIMLKPEDKVRIDWQNVVLEHAFKCPM